MSDEYRSERETGMEDINNLLRSAGLSPIGEEEAAAPAAQPQDKTKHFDLRQAQDGKTIVYGSQSAPASSEQNREDQMLLDGFDAAQDPPKRMSEAQMEAAVQKNRRSLVENFRVLSQEESDSTILEKDESGNGAESVFDSLEVPAGEPLFEAVAQAQKKRLHVRRNPGRLLPAAKQQAAEEQPQDLKTLLETLPARQKKARTKLIVQTALFALALLLMLFAAGGAPAFLFGSGARIFTLINLLLLLGSALTAVDFVSRGVEAIRARTLNLSVCVCFLAALAVLHGVWMLIAGMTETGGFVSFALCAVFAFLAQSAADWMALQAQANDLAVLQKAESLRQLRPVENERDATAMAHGITTKDVPRILFASQTGSDLLIPPAREGTLQKKIINYGTILVAALSLIFALVRAISAKSAPLFINALVSCAFLCAPILLQLVRVVLKLRADAALAGAGVAVTDSGAAQALGTADAVVLDSEDIFEARVSNFRAVPGGGMSRQDAAIYATAALRASGSLLAVPFAEFAQELDTTVPAAEDLQYEDKLGYACWVAGRRVLVGTREMLVQHSIPAPTAEEEAAYAGKRCALYVAVEGLVAATFLVVYRVRSEAKRFCRMFGKTGLVLFLNCADPSLTEEFVAKKLAADVSSIKMMNAKGAQIIADCRAEQPAVPAPGLFCSRNHRNLLQLIAAAYRLYDADRLAGIIQGAGSVFCFLLLLICVVFKISSFFAPLTVIFLQLLWGTVAFYVGASRMK